MIRKFKFLLGRFFRGPVYLGNFYVFVLAVSFLCIERASITDGLQQQKVLQQLQLWALKRCDELSCKPGYKCVLKEIPCTTAPCELTAFCATDEDADNWSNRCKSLGCTSPNQCFLRNFQDKCNRARCRDELDCLDADKSYYSELKSLKYCQGWICPAKLMCYAKVESYCPQGECKVNRTCDSVQDYYEQVDSTTTSIPEDFERQILMKDLMNLDEFDTLNSAIRNRDDEYTRSIFRENPQIFLEQKPVSTVKTKRLSSQLNSTRDINSDALYLKEKAGSKAVKFWIEKSKINNPQDFEDFLKWMTVVENILDPDLYKLWLQRVARATDNIPEFQSWLSLRNRQLHKTTPTTRRVTEARSFIETDGPGADILIPDSMVLHAKNLFYSDKNFINVEPSTNPSKLPIFFDKQTASTLIGQHKILNVDQYENDKQHSSYNQEPQPQYQWQYEQQQPRQDPIIFANINQPQYYEQPTPTYRYQPPPSPHPTASHYESRRPNPGYQYILPDPRIKQPAMNIPRSNDLPPGYQIPVQQPPRYLPPEYQPLDSPEMGSYYINNYTQIQNISLTAIPAYEIQQIEPRFFFPKNNIDFGKTVNTNQWTQAWTNNVPLKRDNHPIIQQESQPGKVEQDPLTAGVGSMIGELKGLEQLKQQLNLKPNIVNLNSSPPVSKMELPSSSDSSGQKPNLLIYFPPPLNFFMYYSVNNNTNEPSNNQDLRTSIPTSSSTQATPADDPIDNIGFRSFPGTALEPKTERIDKDKELEYIRKIIKELIDYWDEKEKSIDNEKKFEKEIPKNPEISTTIQTPLTSTKLPEPQTTTPSFNAFLDWFSKNSDKKFAFSNHDLHNKRPDNESNVTPDSNDLSSIFGGLRDPTERKTRILLDIDKSPELIKLLLEKNKLNSSNLKDNNEYQIILNFDEIVKPNEEDMISRRLIDIATNELHRNVTKKEEIPKILWVFPIYDNENDGTIINEFDKQSKMQSNKFNGVVKEENLIKHNRHRQRPDNRVKTDPRKFKPTQETIIQSIENGDTVGVTTTDKTKDDEDEEYDDQSYYDQQDQRTVEENISREDS